MPISYKILGQIYPTANTLTNVYVTPAVTSAIVNSIYIANQDSANANVDLILRPINETLGNKHYILQNQRLDQADTLIINLNITMNSAIILAVNNTVRAGETQSANISVNAFGLEVT